MDVQTTAAAGPGQSDVVQPTQDAAAAQPAPQASSASSGSEQQQHVTSGESTIASAVAKLYNVTQGTSGEPAQLNVSYKYVSELQLVVTVFTNPQTGEEIQFPPQELLGLAEMFDQIDGVTLDKTV
jgi:uncharacterized FlaG/YvyC family protein